MAHPKPPLKPKSCAKPMRFRVHQECFGSIRPYRWPPVFWDHWDAGCVKSQEQTKQTILQPVRSGSSYQPSQQHYCLHRTPIGYRCRDCRRFAQCGLALISERIRNGDPVIDLAWIEILRPNSLAA